MPYSSVYITTRDEAEAHRIGRVLVEEKLVACANYCPIKSIYRWQGKVEEEGEVLMFVKTRSELVEAVIEKVKELHSYIVPCVVSFPIEKGNPDYLKWIDESTR